MNYDGYYIPEYLKDSLNRQEYSNAYFLFHHLIRKKDTGKSTALTNQTAVADINRVMTTNFVKEDAQYISKHLKLISSMPGMQYRAVQTRLETAMAVGLGYQSVTENSMLLHPIYGIPYVPGQSVKGIFRSWYINELFQGDETKACEDALFQFIFGKEAENEEDAKEGKVRFYDAFPVEQDMVLSLDIANNHFPSYYRGDRLKDTDNPNPVKFIVVRGCTIQFGLSVPEKMFAAFQKQCPGALPETDVQNFASTLQENLQCMLVYYGVGAKTAVGYGHFKDQNLYQATASKPKIRSASNKTSLKEGDYVEVYIEGASEKPRFLILDVPGMSKKGKITGMALGYQGKMTNHPLIGQKKRYKYIGESSDGVYLKFEK